jgi:DNA replication regulator DPB11
MLGEEPVEGAMRVIYEDPGQREEKRRLMSLFEGQAGGRDALGSAEKGRGLVRRSTRIAGF